MCSLMIRFDSERRTTFCDLHPFYTCSFLVSFPTSPTCFALLWLISLVYSPFRTYVALC